MPTTGLSNPNNEVADTCHPCGVAGRDLLPEVPAEVPGLVPAPAAVPTGGRAR